MDAKTLKEEYVKTPTLEKLEKLRRNLVDSLEANDASEGFKNLLTLLYPDNAHYIFELLQNAQDANKNSNKKSTVRFILTENELEFEHNGKELFKINDVYSITGLCNTTKKDDKTNIGKYGVGFKSIFAITDKPRIISGDFDFCIEKLFIPILENNVNKNSKSETRFIFPFNISNKNYSQIVVEIQNELSNLGSETLLFLKNISKIEYLLPGGETPGVMELNVEDGITIIRVINPNEKEKIYYWLIYSDEIEITNEEGKTDKYPIAIAFKMEKTAHKERKTNWRIKPEEEGKVCIFFPAVNEKSNLKFHIHAPFASTVARDCVRPCDENNKLIDAIANLFSNALTDIFNRKLLNFDFFGVLPNFKDELPLFYEPIRKKIISIFKEKPYIPTHFSDSYAFSNNLFRCPPPTKSGGLRINDIIEDEDLSFLTGRGTPLWVINVPLNILNQREDNFLKSLDIPEWGKKELELCFNPKTGEERNKIETWIYSKLDDWLIKLYALLENEEIKIDTTLKIVRTNKNIMINPLNVYFLPEDENDISSNQYFVKPEVFNYNEDEKINKCAYDFLRKIGVEPYTENVKIRLQLEELAKYYETINPDISETKYLEDIKMFCSYKHSKDLLHGKYILLDTKNNYCIADTLCTPLINNLINQAELTTEYNIKRISSLYEEKLDKETYVKFEKLIIELGIMHKLEVICIEEYKYYSNWKEKISRDYTIKGIDKIIRVLELEQYKIPYAKLIWDAINEYSDCSPYNYCGAQFKYTNPNGTFKNSFGFKEYNEPSTIVKKLISTAWIPDKEGQLYLPQNISSDMLPDDFILNNKSEIIRELKLGKNKLIEQSELQKRTDAANTLGLSLETIKLIKTAAEAGIDIGKVLNELNDSSQSTTSDENDDLFYPDLEPDDDPFSKEPVKDIEQIKNSMRKEYDDADDVLREIRSLKIRISRKRDMERTHIWGRYKGYCQMCPCPKKNSNWDIAEIFKEPSKEIEIMNLSLCPNCAREYRKLRELNHIMASFTEQILNVNPEENRNVKIGDKNIEFTNKHLAQIKELIIYEKEINGNMKD